jgi:hypothetical protein
LIIDGKFNLLRKPAGTAGDIQIVRSFSFSRVGVGWGLRVRVGGAVEVGRDSGVDETEGVSLAAWPILGVVKGPAVQAEIRKMRTKKDGKKGL